jgi:hypothetical protein
VCLVDGTVKFVVPLARLMYMHSKWKVIRAKI